MFCVVLQQVSYGDLTAKPKTSPDGAPVGDGGDDDEEEDDGLASVAGQLSLAESATRRPSPWAGLKVGLPEKMAAVRAARQREAARQGGLATDAAAGAAEKAESDVALANGNTSASADK